LIKKLPAASGKGVCALDDEDSSKDDEKTITEKSD